MFLLYFYKEKNLKFLMPTTMQLFLLIFAQHKSNNNIVKEKNKTLEKYTLFRDIRIASYNLLEARCKERKRPPRK